MAITSQMVKDLRERTGAGMMDCKKALENSNGDMDKAVEFLREKGLASVAKKAARIAAEGLVGVKTDASSKVAAIAEVNIETDFAAKNDLFKTFVTDIVEQAMESNSKSIEEFLAETWIKDNTKTVSEAVAEKVAVIGEKIDVRRFERVEATEGFVETYIHGGGRIGVVIEFAADTVNDQIKECAKNVAMQVAAIAPLYVNRSEVPEDYIAKETEILKTQAMNENPDKPESIIDKMIVGRLNKQLKEICLVDQVYVKDSDMTVAQYVESVAKANNAKLQVKRFVRFETGEGIAKKEENFAEEVAKQMGM